MIRSSDERKKYRKCCAVIFRGCFTTDVDRTSPGRNKLADHPEAQASAGRRFGGEEGFKEPRDIFLGDADAGVLDGNEQAEFVTTLGLADRYLQLAALAHGVDRIRNEVGEDLVEFSAESAHGRDDGEVADDDDGGCAKAAVVDSEDLFYEGR